FVTDIEEYGRSTLELLSATPSIKNVHNGFASGITWRPETKFEHKARLRAHETLPRGTDTAEQEPRTAWELFFEKL
ncbi:MAG TPA: hypothetical protein PKJ53_02350, partial [Spirochaetales bacterium]|nr:hypothetical protein [Spirochaetales bacterium]